MLQNQEDTWQKRVCYQGDQSEWSERLEQPGQKEIIKTPSSIHATKSHGRSQLPEDLQPPQHRTLRNSFHLWQRLLHRDGALFKWSNFLFLFKEFRWHAKAPQNNNWSWVALLSFANGPWIDLPQVEENHTSRVLFCYNSVLNLQITCWTIKWNSRSQILDWLLKSRTARQCFLTFVARQTTFHLKCYAKITTATRLIFGRLELRCNFILNRKIRDALWDAAFRDQEKGRQRNLLKNQEVRVLIQLLQSFSILRCQRLNFKDSHSRPQQTNSFIINPGASFYVELQYPSLNFI